MKTYWYECQERAMAPRIADGWPEIIPAPHTPNGRLVRREMPSPDEIAAAEARGVERGIEMVRADAPHCRWTCVSADRALAAFRAEGGGA